MHVRLSWQRPARTQAAAAAASGSGGAAGNGPWGLVLECDSVLVDTHVDGHRVAFNRALMVSRRRCRCMFRQPTDAGMSECAATPDLPRHWAMSVHSGLPVFTMTCSIAGMGLDLAWS